jgi:tetratricopeptide (TPR) repeat protein
MPHTKGGQTDPTIHDCLKLPDPPPDLRGSVKAWRQDVEILTYLPEKPDKNPMFLEKRVYQGSSGRVYPLPFIDRIAVEPRRRMWNAIHIENEFLRLMILPEIGGRIHIAYDKTTEYDFVYRQNVIKPALVGLAGPWISGGIEFNWPQHHRPATFMPVETEIEQAPDGSVTVWCSDHDPMLRMKGMHGVCLQPGRAVLELKVRLFNRTQFTQTFLWWANVATQVHEDYQSFFPPDVRFVADHARRAVTSFPLCNGQYYGVNYGRRAQEGLADEEKPGMFVPDGSYPANDLSWYANIPVPTSYMIAGTEQDFFGGYDHKAQAGVVHVASHHIAPGKKQWTWGNHEFGYSWDRSLTDHDGPYIELMAGVYTDNQPDFSWLAPWETKTFTQNWYPIHSIGVPQAATMDAALSIKVEQGRARIGIQATRAFDRATVVLRSNEQKLAEWTVDLEVAKPVLLAAPLASEIASDTIAASVTVDGRTLIEYDPAQIKPAQAPVAAEEPAAPEQIESVEELFLTGLHLEQYRHATRNPEDYWREGLRRDPGETRIHNALGLWHLRSGEFEKAAEHFDAAIARLTRLNSNPRDGEPHYNLGLTRRFQGRHKEAYNAFYKATWNAAWRAPAFFALAECDAANDDWRSALDHVQRSLKADTDNLNARNLLGLVLEKLGDPTAAERVFLETLSLDPLDIGARWHTGIKPRNGQECLDLAFDLIRAGQNEEALKVLNAADIEAVDGSPPIVLLTTAFVQRNLGVFEAAQTCRRAARTPLDYCFPSRLEELLVLESTIHAHDDWVAHAHYLLGNLLYDKRRHQEAIVLWETAAQRNPSFATVHRNLGIAYFNVRHDPAAAKTSFDRAFAANPQDARVLYERDQLWKRVGKAPENRLNELLLYPHLLQLRDDLSVELAMLYNHLDRPEDALHLLLQRKFQPWEGGEGLALAQFERAHLLLGCRALEQGELSAARSEFLAALKPPENLSEVRHLLANQSDILYWLGEVSHRLGEKGAAESWWTRAAQQKGDFQQMAMLAISDMTFWSGLAVKRLGSEQQAESIFQSIYDYSVELEQTEPKIDYFATSLPAMLLFDDDLQSRNRINALFLRAQAVAGLGRTAEAEGLLRKILGIDASHTGALDLLHLLEKAILPDTVH